MTRCPITYDSLNEGRYSPTGLRRISPRLNELQNFPYTVEEQIQEAQLRATKMSIQGAQPKLSAIVNVRDHTFEVVDTGGQYILKPQNQMYAQLPENEDLSMRLGDLAGIEVPFHGMMYSKDGSLTYFIKRFDRRGGDKVVVEDFAQVAGLSRDTKYDYSTEKMVDLIEEHSTFPELEKLKLFRLVLFSYLIGNEDSHLKNFSFIRRDHKIELSPAYDLINTTIASANVTEEMALPLMGKKRNFTKSIFFDYFGRERLQLTGRAIEQVEGELSSAIPDWESLMEISFLSNGQKSAYQQVVQERRHTLGV